MNSNRSFSLSSIGADSSFTLNSDTRIRVLWGVAPTGSMHLGYAAPLFLLRRLQSTGAEIILLLANYHGYLDSTKTKWENIDERTHYYKQVLMRAGFPTIIETKNFYLTNKYIEALFHFSQLCRIQSTLLSGQGTLRSPPELASVSDLIYVTTQVLDVHFLQANLVICGIDESPIYRYGLPLLQEQLNWKCSHIYLPMCPGVTAVEMHASDDDDNKILLSDTPEEVQAKIELHCTLTNNTPSPLLEYCTRTLFPLAGREDLSELLSTLRLRADISVISELSRAISDVLLDLNIETQETVSSFSPTMSHSDSIRDLRQNLITNSGDRNPIDPICLASRVSEAVNSIKEEAIRIVTSQLGYCDDDVQLLWNAAERFLQGLPSLINFHKQLTKFENGSSPQSLWNHSVRLEPWGTMLVCLPANAVIPLSIILPAALSTSGNQLVFAVSSKAREVGTLVIETLQNAIGSKILFCDGGVREAIEELTRDEPVIDALYYMGASKQFAMIAEKCANSGVTLLYEGEGRGVVIVDDSLMADDLGNAVQKIIAAKKFCFGRMCSAPNVVLVAENLFDIFVETYRMECLVNPLGGCPDSVLDGSALETVRRINAVLGKATPSLDCEHEAYPFFWTASFDDALSTKELFCPGIILVSVPNFELCFRALSKLRFRMQVTLFSREASRLDTLVSHTHFARYCSWINPADQDALLPWGNYGCSGFSDVLDFYRKGLRRVIIEGDQLSEHKP